MATTCLDCMVSTGVGDMYGTVGLPSLDEAPRGRGNHRLSRTLSTGGDADTDETFGYIYSGFRALGLRIHSLERYRAFLEEHRQHRLFEWASGENEDTLPPELQGGDRTKFLDYRDPKRAEGYVSRRLVFECPKCDDRFESDSTDWVQPLEPAILTSQQIKHFRERVGEPAECCIHEAEPFQILYMDLDDWLSEHAGHKPIMKLEDPEGA
jgi:hypothetical protein